MRHNLAPILDHWQQSDVNTTKMFFTVGKWGASWSVFSISNGTISTAADSLQVLAQVEVTYRSTNAHAIDRMQSRQRHVATTSGYPYFSCSQQGG